jgi:hypothetical protein
MTDAFRFYNWAQEVNARPEMSNGATAVALALAGFANGQTGLCCPSQAALAAATGMSIRSLAKPLASLVKANLLVINAGSGKRSSSYTLVLPSDVQGTPESVGRVRPRAYAGYAEGRTVTTNRTTNRTSSSSSEVIENGFEPGTDPNYNDDYLNVRSAEMLAAYGEAFDTADPTVTDLAALRSLAAKDEDHEWEDAMSWAAHDPYTLTRIEGGIGRALKIYPALRERLRTSPRARCGECEEDFVPAGEQAERFQRFKERAEVTCPDCQGRIEAFHYQANLEWEKRAITAGHWNPERI